jgi:hypothetical protein
MRLSWQVGDPHSSVLVYRMRPVAHELVGPSAHGCEPGGSEGGLHLLPRAPARAAVLLLLVEGPIVIAIWSEES